MNGLKEISDRNEGPRTDNVRRIRRNAIEWLTRARKALEAGEYELSANQARAAAKEIEILVPVHARATNAA